MKDKKIYPPSTIGILGGGQLGKMLAQDAKKMGYKVITLDPTPNCPCAQVCDEQIVAEFSDKIQALNLAKKADVLTYEFENIPAPTVAYLEKEGIPIFPSSRVLAITQNRITEKRFLKDRGVKTVHFQGVANFSELEQVSKDLGLPAVMKTARGGYDGKGQVVLKKEEDIENIKESLFSQELIYEKFAPFIKEISVICARGRSGQLTTFPVSENIHRHNILYMSIVPARVSKEVKNKAAEIAQGVAEGLGVVGAIGVEMFLLEDETILVNEIAPRVHNSGHYTIEACWTSQFEQHIRAIAGLPLGSTDLLTPAAMVNILGEEGYNGLPDFMGVRQILSIPGVNLHIYGKKITKPFRKMGHVTVVDRNIEGAVEKAIKVEQTLKVISKQEAKI